MKSFTKFVSVIIISLLLLNSTSAAILFADEISELQVDVDGNQDVEFGDETSGSEDTELADDAEGIEITESSEGYNPDYIFFNPPIAAEVLAEDLDEESNSSVIATSEEANVDESESLVYLDSEADVAPLVHSNNVTYNTNESNDTMSTATVIRDGQIVDGELGSYNKYCRDGEDVDYYKIYMVKGKAYQLVIYNWTDALSLTSARFDLIYPDSTVNTRMCQYFSHYAWICAPQTGYYYLKIYNYTDFTNRQDHFYEVSFDNLEDMIMICDVNFPDPNFRNYIDMNFDSYGDGYIDSEDVENIFSIAVQNCTSLQGIELFPNLTQLYATNCNLTSIDLSQNTELHEVKLRNCNLCSLDVSRNRKLGILVCSYNNITSLDLSHNPMLWSLDCQNNGLSTLLLGNSSNFSTLNCNSNNLASIDIRNFQYLKCAFEMGTMTNEIDYRLGAEYLRYEYAYYFGTATIPLYCHLSVDPNTIVISSNPVEMNSSGIEAFINRIYNVALGRSSDSAGLSYWTNQVRNDGKSGAYVARVFLFSQEFLNRTLSNEQFVDILYMTFYNRPSDSSGRSYWASQLARGVSKQEVIEGFINAPEWANICLIYGVDSGSATRPTISVIPNNTINSFAARLYTTCLGRDFDASGLQYWATSLANRKISGTEAARSFFFSAEFISANYSDREFVTRLYRTLFGREADSAGLNYWVAELQNGTTRIIAFYSFTGGQEWANICSNAGIQR